MYIYIVASKFQKAEQSIRYAITIFELAKKELSKLAPHHDKLKNLDALF